MFGKIIIAEFSAAVVGLDTVNAIQEDSAVKIIADSSAQAAEMRPVFGVELSSGENIT